MTCAHGMTRCAALVLALAWSPMVVAAPPDTPSTAATAVRYQSGMSFVAHVGERDLCVSLLGLFAHEIAPPQMATALAPGRHLFLVADPESPERDDAGCLLRYVRLENGAELNTSILRQGAAVLDGRYPFSRRGEFERLVREAREARVGAWGESGMGGNEEVRQRDAEPYFGGIGDVTNPVLSPDSRTPPIYPKRARHEGVTGRSILQIVVRKDGTVGELLVLVTQLVFKDGSHKTIEQPHGGDEDFGLGDASVQAVKSWRYRPATLDGHPVAVYFTVVVDFALDLPRPGS